MAMTPEEALAAQVRHYRHLTGEQRMEIALALHELACEVAREGIRGQHPGESPAEVERLLRKRFEAARAA